MYDPDGGRPVRQGIRYPRMLLGGLVCLAMGLHLDARGAYGQSEGPAWRATVTASPYVVWEDSLNGSDFGFEIAARTLRLRDLPIPLGIGFRLAKNFAHGEALNQGSTFLIAELYPNGYPLDVEVGVFSGERRSCEECRTVTDGGLELGVGSPSLFRMKLGEFTGALSLGTRVMFGGGFSYSTVVGFGITQTSDKWKSH